MMLLTPDDAFDAASFFIFFIVVFFFIFSHFAASSSCRLHASPFTPISSSLISSFSRFAEYNGTRHFALLMPSRAFAYCFSP